MTDTAPEVESATWIVQEHKTLESCIQYLGKEKWACWTDPAVKVGDILVSRMGRFKVTASVPADEPVTPPVPQLFNIVAVPEIPQ